MNFAELKTKAKEQIKGKIGILFLITLIIAVLSAAASWLITLIPVVGAILAPWVVAPAFVLSTMRIYLSLTAGVKPETGDAFSGFDDYWSAVKVTFLVGLFTFLWSLLFIIPGIVKALSYSMSTYILAENKGKSAMECINESKAMTNGYKGELFLLGLSFIGWELLCVITCGIAGIWVYPYIQATFANAYLELKSRVEIPAAEAFIAE
jgi:uncharacterized membrane protein